MKKSGVIFIVISFLFMAACGQQEPREIELKPYSITDFAESDLTSIDKIRIKNGETGEEKTITDPAEVSTWLSFLTEIQFTPDLNQDQRAGWLYQITLYEGKKKEFEFYLNNIDNIYVEVDDSVMTEFDERFYK